MRRHTLHLSPCTFQVAGPRNRDKEAAILRKQSQRVSQSRGKLDFYGLAQARRHRIRLYLMGPDSICFSDFGVIDLILPYILKPTLFQIQMMKKFASFQRYVCYVKRICVHMCDFMSSRVWKIKDASLFLSSLRRFNDCFNQYTMAEVIL